MNGVAGAGSGEEIDVSELKLPVAHADSQFLHRSSVEDRAPSKITS